MIITKQTADHYQWGDKCDGWYFAKNKNQTVILEKMPPHTQENRHYHKQAHQFFFIITGTATIEISNEIFTLHSQQGIEITPGLPHQIFNKSDADIEFLVITQPPSKGDRFDCES
ncbi:cupin domain-containing protein [Bacillus salitolerans]|uniref:Cupin domain-containing protein n=1 Tax=Bacillus salitolerans TaxID=1437434 RepID=A0ABW4LQA0_9BACI